MSHATDILRDWDWSHSPSLSGVDSGLINITHMVHVDGTVAAVLQRLNTDIFVPQVHEDIEAVTSHLQQHGLTTPRLMRTRDGSLWATDPDGGVWRCLTPVGDRTIDKIADPADAIAAGGLVARFHAAVRDLDWDFRSVRPGSQDTKKHLRNLTAATAKHRGHRLYDEVARVADEVHAAWQTWEGPTDLPQRVIHGDLKISNVRFSGAQATALIDLDTLAVCTLDVDLGDAFRSWCNPATEEAPQSVFDLDLFAAGMRGYRSQARDVSEDEWSAIVPGIERISLNLTARFAADALQESYFGWNAKYGGRGEHNLLRAKGQWSLNRSLHAARAKAERLVRAT